MAWAITLVVLLASGSAGVRHQWAWVAAAGVFLGLIGLAEPFKGLFTQGMVTHETYQSADGEWLSPEEVRIETVGGQRFGRLQLLLRGEPDGVAAAERFVRAGDLAEVAR